MKLSLEGIGALLGRQTEYTCIARIVPGGPADKDGRLKAGDRVVMMYSSANFDEEVFADPLPFAITRSHNPHMAFGHGIHLCLGAPLARMEARVFFEEFFAHFAAIESRGEPVFIRSNSIHGFKSMPVLLTPA